MRVLFLQIWTMLPGFCTCPVDLLTSFKGMARVLGMAINERPDLRLTVCHALRIIINKSCSTGRKIDTFTERQMKISATSRSDCVMFCLLRVSKRKKRLRWAASPRTSCPSSSTCTVSSLQLESRPPTGWLCWTPSRCT